MGGFRIIGRRKAKLVAHINDTIKALFKKGINAKALCKNLDIPLYENEGNWSPDFMAISTKKLSGINSRLKGFM